MDCFLFFLLFHDLCSVILFLLWCFSGCFITIFSCCGFFVMLFHLENYCIQVVYLFSIMFFRCQVSFNFVKPEGGNESQQCEQKTTHIAVFC